MTRFRCTLAGLIVAATAACASATEHPQAITVWPSSAPPPMTRPVPRQAEPARVPDWWVDIGPNTSSPMFYDLDGDGVLEVITSDDYYTYVFNASGGLWPGWPQAGSGSVMGIPAVADIDEDGRPEILIGTRSIQIICFNTDGTIQTGFPVGLPHGVWGGTSCPAVADVDGAGHLDVGAPSQLGVAFFDRVGHPLPGWPYLWDTPQNFAMAGPAVADLDGDGSCEVVVGNNNISGYDGVNHSILACGVHVIRADGSAMPGWPRPTSCIFASPAVGDLDGDGDLEIVVHEGDWGFWGTRMHVWHHDGSDVAGWPREIAVHGQGSRSDGALADVDSDGTLEIVLHSGSVPTAAAAGEPMLHIFRVDGTEMPGYPRRLPILCDSISSVQVVDTNADGWAEFFLCYWESGSQWVSGWAFDGVTLTGFPRLIFAETELAAHGSAHLADLEGDGDLDLCVQGSNWTHGRLRVLEVPGSTWHAQPDRPDWPKIRRDACNTGFCPAPASRPEARDIHPVVQSPAFPNPVSLSGVLSFRLAEDQRQRIALFDLAGRRLGAAEVSGRRDGSIAIRSLFAAEPAAGIYLLRLESFGTGTVQTMRIVILD